MVLQYFEFFYPPFLIQLLLLFYPPLTVSLFPYFPNAYDDPALTVEVNILSIASLTCFGAQSFPIE
jgi:hypothetical protein